MPPEESTAYQVRRPSFEDENLTAEAVAGEQRERVAVFVAHGMGQQIPFETLDQIALGLRKRHPDWKEGDPKSVPGFAHTVKAEDKIQLQRLELKLKRAGGEEHDVHVYEAYWAPLTEGRVTLRDAMRLLFNGGRNGLNVSLGSFKRWLFGENQSFPVPVVTVLFLFVALAVAASLVLLNTTILLVAASLLPLGTATSWLTSGLLKDLTTTFNFVVAWMVLFGLMLWIASRLRKGKVSPRVRLVWTLFTAILFTVTLFVTIGAGLAVPLLVYGHLSVKSRTPIWDDLLKSDRLEIFNDVFGCVAFTVLISAAVAYLVVKAAQLFRALKKDFDDGYGNRWWTVTVMSAFLVMMGGTAYGVYALLKQLPGDGVLETVLESVAWPMLIVISAFVRKFLVQYLGDVAAYVTPHTLDRFFDLRREIRQMVRTALRAVYELKENSRGYDKVVVVGHSLGSVIVYDALNSMINEDILNGGNLNVVSRTPLLLTFGSPLDKTAFLFAIQKSNVSEARDALAAAVQPFLQAWNLRPNRWVNIYTPWDIIGGALGFYDPPNELSHPKAVCNLIDPEATTLLAAHTEYWEDPMLYEILFEEVTRKTGEEPPGCDHWRYPWWRPVR